MLGMQISSIVLTTINNVEAADHDKLFECVAALNAALEDVAAPIRLSVASRTQSEGSSMITTVKIEAKMLRQP
jgi:hypothetical protein